MNITVYLGASLGTDHALPQAVQQLGRWIGESGNALVYGGSKSGLMGLLADSVLAAGGRVTGVEPKCFLDAELHQVVKVCSNSDKHIALTIGRKESFHNVFLLIKSLAKQYHLYIQLKFA